MSISLIVNGIEREVQADPEMPLLWVLRESLGLQGTKFGCGIGVCGACTVHLDGVAIRSCITSLAEVESGAITTIEGLSAEGGHPLQVSWLEENVTQCGYCQPGQIMAAAALLAENPNPSEEEIVAQMRGNLCRCGTYPRIRRAIARTIENGGA